MSENTTAGTATDSTAAERRMSPRTRGALIALGVLGVGAASAAGLFFSGFFEPKAVRDLAEQSSYQLDLQRPDALIESASLSRLPKDLLSVPLLRDTLTEDFVFYYESHADRLGLLGSLRRIIFEHELTLQDNLIEELLDQPAEVALWRGADGKLKNFVLLMERGGLAKVLEPLARIASDDTQMRQVGELDVDGDAVALYRLRYNAERALLFASYGDKLLVLSNQGMLFDGDYEGAQQARDATESIEALLAGDDPFHERFGLDTREASSQRISLSSSYLAFGYQRFIPAFAGLRFEMDDAGWHSFLALNEAEDQPAFDFSPVWRAMPMGASACVALPVAAGASEQILVKVGAEDDMAKELTSHLTGAAGLCWYAESRLHSPLLVGQLDAPPSKEVDESIGTLFGSVIGAWEANAVGGSFPVTGETHGEQRTWQREVSSNFGQYPASQAEQPDALAASGFFRISLARHGSTLLFSLDDRLVDKALSTLDKRFPPLADVLPKDALVPAYLAPDTLSALFERETLDSLPADMEPVFRNAAQAHLLPKLRTLAGQKKYALTLPADAEASDAWQWLPLEWRAL
ncbi:DUF2138 domain-containing protein [Pseudomonas sp. PDM14]|uniref:DUF2138 domain-containing protein n=1 Tax=Pseudomonas sp. PDM14 TaxID=2769288 RepID=UPI001CE14346|nr:DUF2138 domain-containing protein [Pseudomonas sp. PDM14]